MQDHTTSMRTDMCGQLTAADAGRTVSVCGWVDRRREHGEHLAFIEGLRDRVEGLLYLSCGRDPGGGEGSGVHRFTHGFVMRFASRDALTAWNKSDLHEELVAGFRDDMDDKIVLDYDAA